MSCGDHTKSAKSQSSLLQSPHRLHRFCKCLSAAGAKGIVSFNRMETGLSREVAHRFGTSRDNTAAAGTKWSRGHVLDDASSVDILRTT